jgi:Xaa-Pro aminopeptidase
LEMSKENLFLEKVKCDGLIFAFSSDSFLTLPSDRLLKLTGFSGSFGIAFVLPKEKILWTDSRYTLQAAEQSSFQIKNIADGSFYDYIARQSLHGLKIACFPQLCSADGFEKLQGAFLKAGAVCVSVSVDVLDSVIETKVEPEPVSFPYPIDFAGKTTEEKIKDLLFSIKDELEQTGSEGVLINDAASVSWLLNKRADRPYTPVVFNRVFIDKQGRLFVLPNLNDSADESANKTDEERKVWNFFSHKKVLTDFSQITAALKTKAEKEGVVLVRGKNPCDALKAVKNKTELEKIKEVSLRESAVLCSFFLWLKDNFKGQTELSVVDYLHQLRRKIPDYKGDSFPAISAFGAHGAVVHYQPNEKTDIPLEQGGLYLLDTGGQYLGGTTDVTRTIALGKADKEAKKYFTAVLQGHIALAEAIFPKKTRSNQLDAFARGPLWRIGADYGHGTGHGIGAFLNVHETPPSVSPYGGEELKEGMILSNEPGVYLENKFGIRLENMMAVVPFSKNNNFLCFEMISFIPFDLELVETALLSIREKEWLQKYCDLILKKISPLMEEKDRQKLSDYITRTRELLK